MAAPSQTENPMFPDHELRLSLRWEQVQKERLLDTLDALARENRQLRERVLELEHQVADLERRNLEDLQQRPLW